MLVDTERMIPITKLQKELTQRIREISNDGNPLYVLKNNEMEAVILSPSDYEYLMTLNDLIEYYEIDNVIKGRMKNYNRSKNIKWEELKKS
jgi:PHD/YefM family antitoxin component YafN of YafNO toxin-antitoxin module